MKRLDGLYSLIRPAQPLWDIGCDHGLLGIRALKERLVPKVYFVDCARPAIDRLEKVLPVELRDRSVVMHARGQDLSWDEVSGTVIISGVGTNTIIKILQTVPVYRRSHIKFILCAEKGDPNIFLEGEGWQTTQFTVVQGPRNRIITETIRFLGHSL